MSVFTPKLTFNVTLPKKNKPKLYTPSAAGVPDRYIEAIGGWKPGSNVLKRTYENVIDMERRRVQDAYLQQHRFSV